ncbi:type IX secretion system sortase PorU [Croceiramulus getboli]|nr:type IX secretion system sortase PorU [Flavobacteriaceae bacterium YJPT1-3]
MKTIFTFLLLFLTLFSWGQTKRLQINWEAEVTVATGKGVQKIPGFEQRFMSYVPDYGLRYVNQWKASSDFDPAFAKAENIQYQSISVQELGALDPSSIPTGPEFKCYRVRARDEQRVAVEISPIIKRNGRYQKIVSFEVNLPRSNGKSAAFPKVIVNSVLAQGDFYRFYVDRTGVFRLDRNFLRSLGMNVEAIDVSRLKIYGNGGQMLPLRNSDNTVFDLRENAIQIVGGEDGSFDNGDYILFYGEGTRGFNAESLTHINAYADRSYYYITADGALGQRITDLVQPTTSPSVTYTTFDDYQFHEEDLESLVKIGRRWFGERFDFENEQSFSFNFPNRTSAPIDLRVFVAAISESNTNFTLSVNGQVVDDLPLVPITDVTLARGNAYSTYENPNSDTPVAVTGDEITVTLSYDNGGNPGSIGYLDFIGLGAERNLQGTDAQFMFQKLEAATASGVAQYQLSTMQAYSAIWEVTNPESITALSNAEGSGNINFNSTLGVARKFIALRPDDFYTPLTDNTAVVANQNLKGTLLTDGQGGFQDVDYLMVTSELLRPEAERLAQHNRDFRGLSVRVVTDQQIYNEFSSGKQDIGAIRNLVRYLYENASAPENRIQYLCLFGDTSVDYKDRLAGNNNVLPSFQAYNSFSLVGGFMSDDFFGYMDPEEGYTENFSGQGIYAPDLPNGGADLLDIAVGRIVVDSPQLARAVVDKIINYDQQASYGRWRTNFVLVSDDVDPRSNGGNDSDLQQSLDDLGDEIGLQRPEINVVKIHADSYQQETAAGGDRYPTVNEAIADAIEVGSLVMTYLGHGGEDTLAAEFIFTQDNAEDLANGERLPLIVTVTCEFTKFDNPLRPTGGEKAFWNAQGGAIGLVTTTREIFVGLGKQFNEELAPNLFAFGTNNIRSVAENVRETKNMISNPIRKVIFMVGDPAMKLAFPKPSVQLTAINDQPITQADTLQALGRVKISGQVVNASGQLIPDYNGNLAVTLYDKRVDRQTLGNDGVTNSSGELIIMDFTTLGNILFRGQATVTNGTFEVSFVMPRDTAIPLGNGRLSFYASRSGALEDQSGANQSIIVGGLNENAPEDNEGPLIRLFMNDESFVNGGITNSSPFLLAKLEDENGINTASGIGHDILAILDGDETEPIILNDFYEADPDDFTRGTVLRKLRDLAPGLHTLTLKAWDTYNNSSMADITFVVAGDEEIELENVLNYPNPFVNYTEFWFNHNRPFEPLEVQVQIFTITGKVVKTINQTVMTNGFLARDIIWDGRDDFGDRIGKGVYIYTITVKSTLTNKRVEKTEKLVIL